jgi:hypothetical protein
MKIFIQKLSEITIPEQKETPKRPWRPAEARVRFSLTLAEDDGEPLLTIDGWTVDRNRVVRPPYTRGKFSTGYVTYQHPSKPFLERITAAVMSVPDVDVILGPPEPGWVAPLGRKKIEGKVEVSK